MEDNWADDDIENELAPIAVQLAYVQQVMIMWYLASLTFKCKCTENLNLLPFLSYLEISKKLCRHT